MSAFQLESFEQAWRLDYRRIIPILPLDCSISPTSSLSRRK